MYLLSFSLIVFSIGFFGGFVIARRLYVKIIKTHSTAHNAACKESRMLREKKRTLEKKLNSIYSGFIRIKFVENKILISIN
jgi:uncharacterized protein YneF (UPF0154 family)